MKRDLVLKWYDLQPESAATKYAVGLKIAQKAIEDQN
jgi:hypothetical protein